MYRLPRVRNGFCRARIKTMVLHLVTHHFSLLHRVPAGHPERRDRVVAVTDALRAGQFEVSEIEAPVVDRELLRVVHDEEYINTVREFCVAGGGSIDPDTYVVPASWDAAQRAAGAGPAAVDRLRSASGSAFVAVRPPGHHAERDKAMGFCLFNNIAITAAYLRDAGERVAIVDWDVHHGNGTQNTFADDPDVLYLSIHEFPFYPGTGWVTEAGVGAGEGATVNVALPAGTSAHDYLAAFQTLVMPPLRQFAPTWILISSGFDAHRDDPLGSLLLESEHYGWMSGALRSVVPENRIVAFLEGGYNLRALGSSAVATVAGLEGAYDEVEWPEELTGQARRVTDMAADVVSRYWELG